MIYTDGKYENMLYTPLWKRVVIWAVVALGMVLAMPNLFYARVEARNSVGKAAQMRTRSK